MPRESPLVIVLSGPSGVGKDAVLRTMREAGHNFHCVVTVTTRHQRPGERGEVDYHFISQETFQNMVDKGEFLEWAEVYGNRYGVPRRQVKEALEKGKDVIIKVDVQGAATIKRILPRAILVFLAPPSLEELADRLERRKSEPDFNLELRMERARGEMRTLSMFDYLVVNHRDRIELAVSQINAIIEAERCRVRRPKLEGNFQK
jgi:guanylate kinase